MYYTIFYSIYLHYSKIFYHFLIPVVMENYFTRSTYPVIFVTIIIM